MRLTLNIPTAFVGCVNSSACLRGSSCVTRNNLSFCECPRYWNPLDNCATDFHASRQMVPYYVATAVLIAWGLALIGLSIRSLGDKMASKASCIGLRYRILILLCLNVMCATLGPVSFILAFSWHHRAYVVVFVWQSSLMVQAFIVALYLLFRLMAKMHGFGHEQRRYYWLSVAFVIIGCGFMTIATTIGMIRCFLYPDSPTLDVINSICVVIGVIVPIIVVTRDFIVTLWRCHRLLYSELAQQIRDVGIGRARALWHLTWVMVANAVLILLILITIVLFRYLTYEKLFDTIIFNDMLSGLCCALANGGITLFIHLMPNDTGHARQHAHRHSMSTITDNSELPPTFKSSTHLDTTEAIAAAGLKDVFFNTTTTTTWEFTTQDRPERTTTTTTITAFASHQDVTPDT